MPRKAKPHRDLQRVVASCDGADQGRHHIDIRHLLAAVDRDGYLDVLLAASQLLTDLNRRREQQLAYPLLLIGGQRRQEHQFKNAIDIVMLEEIELGVHVYHKVHKSLRRFVLAIVAELLEEAFLGAAVEHLK